MVEQSTRAMRRAHKKSRKGCLECKRRHIRCDEKRPHCINCARAERTCSYPGAPPAPSRPATSGHVSGAAIPDGDGDGDGLGCRDGDGSRTNPGGDQDTDGGGREASSVNLTHLKLFHHLLYLLRQVADHEPAIGQLDLDAYVEAAMRAPYLMHAALAFSARHLSITEAGEKDGGSGQAEFYQTQATALQTRAIRLFNAPLPALDRENGLAVFLFSNLIGIHTLSDALLAHHRDDDADELAPFLRRFVDAVKLHRGVKTVAAGCWPLLLQTELHPVLEWGREATAGKGRGDHLRAVRRCLAGAELDDEERRDCEQALDHLQWAVDDDEDEKSQGQQQEQPPSSRPHLSRPTRMVFSWPVIVSPRFVDMLDRHRGEALAVLACYGAVLHHCERLWLVGQAGRRLVHRIATALGAVWVPWLEWPLGVVGGSPPSGLDSPAAGQT